MDATLGTLCGTIVVTIGGVAGIYLKARSELRKAVGSVKDTIETTHQSTLEAASARTQVVDSRLARANQIIEELRAQIETDSARKDNALEEIHLMVNSRLERLLEEVKQQQSRIAHLEARERELEEMVTELQRRTDRRKEPRQTNGKRVKGAS